MYKLFLTLRYLTRKKIVLFPILAVWLCVMMMIIVTSIMGGFVQRAQQVNRDLNGDVIISSPSFAGWPYYEELSREIQRKVPEITATTPLVRGFGLINLPDRGATRGVMITGVDPIGRSKVSPFRESLFRQYKAPIEAANDLAALGLPKSGEELTKFAKAADDVTWHKASDMLSTPIRPRPPQPNYWATAGYVLVVLLAWYLLGKRRRRTVWSVLSSITVFLAGSALVTLILLWPFIFPARFSRMEDEREQVTLAADRSFRAARYAASLDPKAVFTSKQQILDVLLPKEPSFNVPAEAQARNGGPESTPTDGCYVGVEFGLTERDRRGNFHHYPDSEFVKVIVTVVPISARGSVSSGHAAQHQFVITDDFYSGVIDVDKQTVYAPFDIVQDMAGMKGTDPKFLEEHPEALNEPSRCNEVLIKLKPGSTLAQINAARDRIADVVDKFRETHADLRRLDVLTWEQQQKTYLDAVKNEKVMITFILLLMSGVVLVVIFLIFYQIVRDKTRDIGIIKAVGGSEEGVAAIFLSYGVFIGLVGGLMGVVGGVTFVRYTNEIHDFIFRLTGHMIWDRKVYLFDQIPNTYDPWEVAAYFGLALAAGILGALIPAIVAGSEDPVKAVRYE